MPLTTNPTASSATSAQGVHVMCSAMNCTHVSIACENLCAAHFNERKNAAAPFTCTKCNKRPKTSDFFCDECRDATTRAQLQATLKQLSIERKHLVAVEKQFQHAKEELTKIEKTVRQVQGAISEKETLVEILRLQMRQNENPAAIATLIADDDFEAAASEVMDELEHPHKQHHDSLISQQQSPDDVHLSSNSQAGIVPDENPVPIFEDDEETAIN